VPPDDEWVVLKTYRGCQFVINWKQTVNLIGPTVLNTAMHGQQNIKFDQVLYPADLSVTAI
jgi:hypothetical protein